MKSTPEPNRPTGITQIGHEALEVAWSDRHVSRFPLGELRRLCVCASCETRRADQARQTGPFRVLGAEPSTEPVALEQLGNYALGVTWGDQHHSIFAFDHLRRCCPCPACADRRVAPSAPGGRAGGTGE